MTTPIIIDTDPGIDDIIEFLVAHISCRWYANGDTRFDMQELFIGR